MICALEVIYICCSYMVEIVWDGVILRVCSPLLIHIDTLVAWN